MRKKALLAVMMAMVLMLSGCALIQKDEAVDNATEIIRMGDQVITKAEIKSLTDSTLLNNGYSLKDVDPSLYAQAEEHVVERMKQDLTLTAKAKELGLDQLTDEELETVNKEVPDQLDYYKTFTRLMNQSALEGKSDEEAEQIISDLMERNGYTEENIIETEKKQLIDNKLLDYTCKDVTVTDEEIQAEYDSKVASDKETYAEKAGSWAAAANNGSTLYYTPAGVRRVKQILTKFKEEDQKVIDEAKAKAKDVQSDVNTAQAKINDAQKVLDTKDITEELKAEAEADLEAAKKELEEANAALEAANKAVEDATAKGFENIDEDTDAILASLDAEGADWNAIMEEKNQDSGMKDNEKGYAVSADMTSFDAPFVEAAMALAKPGDHSSKVKGQYGYYIIRYDSDETEGPIALETVKETISSSLLNTKKNEVYSDAVTKWVEEAGIKVDMNALKD